MLGGYSANRLLLFGPNSRKFESSFLKIKKVFCFVGIPLDRESKMLK